MTRFLPWLKRLFSPSNPARELALIGSAQRRQHVQATADKLAAEIGYTGPPRWRPDHRRAF